ncbi:NAD-dependent epimerase/dehydratase family protein [Streptacidiphilus sp. PAMC 29251]
MQILVTGGAGYLGRAVVHRLLFSGADIAVLKHISGHSWDPRVRVVSGDLLSVPDLTEAVRGVDSICHLAADKTVRRTTNAGTRAQRRVIVEGTELVLAAASAEVQRSGNPIRLVNMSSSAVYGVPVPRPLLVEDAADPVSDYGSAKRAAEMAVDRAVAADGGIGATTFRLFNAVGVTPCGTMPDPRGLIPRAVAAARGESGRFVVNGTGQAMRDFVHVRDVADAVVAGLAAATPGSHRTYNIGATPASVADVISLVGEISGKKVPVEHGPESRQDSSYLVADIGRTLSDLNWTPKRSGLERAILEQISG